MSQLLTPSIGNTKSAAALGSFIFVLILTLVNRFFGTLPKLTSVSEFFGFVIVTLFITSWIIAIFGPYFLGRIQEFFIQNYQVKSRLKTARQEFYYGNLRDRVIAEFIFALTIIIFGFLIMNTGRFLLLSFTSIDVTSYSGPSKVTIGWICVASGIILVVASILKTNGQSKHLEILIWINNLRNEETTGKRTAILDEIAPYLLRGDWLGLESVINAQLISQAQTNLTSLFDELETLSLFMQNHASSFFGFFQAPSRDNTLGISTHSYDEVSSYVSSIISPRDIEGLSTLRVLYGRNRFKNNLFSESLIFDLRVIRWLDCLFLKLISIALIASIKSVEPSGISVESTIPDYNFRYDRAQLIDEDQGSFEVFILTLLTAHYLLVNNPNINNIEICQSVILVNNDYKLIEFKEIKILRSLIDYFTKDKISIAGLSKHVTTEKIIEWKSTYIKSINNILQFTEVQIKNSKIPNALKYHRNFINLKDTQIETTYGNIILWFSTFRRSVIASIEENLKQAKQLVKEMHVDKLTQERVEEERRVKRDQSRSIGKIVFNIVEIYQVFIDSQINNIRRNLNKMMLEFNYGIQYIIGFRERRRQKKLHESED